MDILVYYLDGDSLEMHEQKFFGTGAKITSKFYCLEGNEIQLDLT